jgi:hypothetical protein
MNNKQKFLIGDEVYFIHNSDRKKEDTYHEFDLYFSTQGIVIEEAEITEAKREPTTKIKYNCKVTVKNKGYEEYRDICECNIFTTKQEAMIHANYIYRQLIGIYLDKMLKLLE